MIITSNIATSRYHEILFGSTCSAAPFAGISNLLFSIIICNISTNIYFKQYFCSLRMQKLKHVFFGNNRNVICVICLKLTGSYFKSSNFLTQDPHFLAYGMLFWWVIKLRKWNCTFGTPFQYYPAKVNIHFLIQLFRNVSKPIYDNIQQLWM